MLSDAYDREFVPLEVASPSDGDVEVHKFDRAEAARIMKESGCDEGFDETCCNGKNSQGFHKAVSA